MEAWLAEDLSRLDLLAVQIDGIHLAEELLLVAAVGIDGDGTKHPLGLVEGATENAAVVQALLDGLVKRGLDASMALRWTVAAMLEAAKGFRRLKVKSQLPQLRAALLAHRQMADHDASVAQAQQAA